MNLVLRFLNFPTRSLRNIFSVIHPSLPASLLSFTSALFSITSPIVHFLLLRMGFRCSDLSCAGRVMDKPPPFLTTHSAQLHKHTHARSRSRRHGYPHHHLSAGQWRPEEITKTLYQAVLPLCLRLLITLLAGGGHSSHNGWYASGDDRALSKSLGGGVQAGVFLFWKVIDWWVLLQNRGSRLIGKVNSRGKWVLMKAYMCPQTQDTNCCKSVNSEAVVLLKAQRM